jgi:hypothetical protein
MNLIIFLLIVFFVIMMGVSIMNRFMNSPTVYPYSGVHEGMTDGTPTTTTTTTDASGGSSDADYQEYSPNDALILAKQNAGNISYLKSRVDGLDQTSEKMSRYVFDISNNLVALNDQVNTIIEQQAQYAQSVATPVPPTDLSMPPTTDSATTDSATTGGVG